MWWYRSAGAAAAVILLVILLLGRGEKGTEKMLAYMEEKYGEGFVYVEAYAGQLGKDYKMIRVRSRDEPEREALVRRMVCEGEEVFQDNYPACLLKGKIEERIKQCAEPVFGACSVWYKIPSMVFPRDFSADMEVDAFLRHPHSMVRIYFYPRGRAQKAEEKTRLLCEALKKEGFIMAGTVSWTEDEEAAVFSFQIDEDGNCRYYKR